MPINLSPDILKRSDKKDEELVEQLRNGSHSAFGTLYARYKRQLTAYCYRFLKDEDEVEDVVQDIFLQLWETRDSLNTTLSFSSYLYTLAHNRMLNLIRQWNVHTHFAEKMAMNAKEATNETEETIMDNDYYALLNEMIDSLSPKQKEIFRLSRIEGLTYKEIAEKMHISVDTVQEHASLALRKIKKLLSQHADIHFKTIIAILMIFL